MDSGQEDIKEVVLEEAGAQENVGAEHTMPARSTMVSYVRGPSAVQKICCQAGMEQGCLRIMGAG